MRNIYFLQIGVSDTILLIDKILGINHNTDCFWQFRIEDEEESMYYMHFLMDLLKNKYADLLKIGVERDVISIWRLYEYDQQCNMEYSPSILKRMADNGVTFCISCWDSGLEYTIDERILN